MIGQHGRNIDQSEFSSAIFGHAYSLTIRHCSADTKSVQCPSGKNSIVIGRVCAGPLTSALPWRVNSRIHYYGILFPVKIYELVHNRRQAILLRERPAEGAAIPHIDR